MPSVVGQITKGAVFDGIVAANEVVGGGGDGTLDDACVASSNVTQHQGDIKLDNLGAPDDNTDLDFSTSLHGLVPKGTNVGHFLKDDGTWAATSGGGGTVDTSGTPVANDYARFTDADTIEGRDYSQVRGDLGLVIGTDVLAQQAIGIADDNLVEVDDATDVTGQYAKFTASGLQGKTLAEVAGEIEGSIDHDNVSNVTSDQHHAQSHTVASHSDTTATGAELETLTDGSDADALHIHALADAHIASTVNPHATDVENLGSGTLVELNAAITDATLDDSSDSRTPSGSAGGDLTDTYPNPTVANDAVTYAKMQNVSATDRFLGRDTAGAGDVEEIAAGAARTILNVEDGANNYSHPNHTGDVMSVGDGATTVMAGVISNIKLSNVSEATLKGRPVSSGTGTPVDMVASQVRTILNVADGADVTGDNPPQAHKDSHDPGGSDGLDVATPTDIGTANTPGSAASFVRSDHVHKIPDKWRTRSFLVEVPTPADDDEFIVHWFPNASTLTQVRVHVEAATSTTFELTERGYDTPDTGGTDISASAIVATVTPANVSMNNTSMAANSVLVYHSSAVSGTPGKVWIFGKYTVD